MTAALYPILNGSTADVDGYFEISGNYTTTFAPGFPFVAIDSGGSPVIVQTAITTTVLTSNYTGSVTQIIPNGGFGSALTIPTPNGSYVTIAGGAYSLDKSDVSKSPIVVTPGSLNTSTSLVFPGRASLNFGEHINEDMLHLLEHFASPTAPANPIDGQIWYDTLNPLNKLLKIYDEDSTIWNIVGSGGSSFWRDPVRVAITTIFADLAAAEASINANPSPQGISSPLSEGDRILFTNVGGGSPSDDSNIYIVRGASPLTLEDDNNRYPAAPARGDAVYIVEGSAAHTIFFYDENDMWTEFSGGSGGGFTLAYEVQLVTSPQTVFTLTNPYNVTPDGSGLFVFVNGVKQIPDKGGAASGGYTETDQLTVTFNTSQSVGKVVEFYILIPTTDKGVAVRELRDSSNGSPIIITGSPVSGNITLDVVSYVVGAESLSVYLNGQKAARDVDYVEVDPGTILWTGVPINTSANDVMEFFSYAPVIAGTKLGDIQDVNPAASYGSPGPNIGDVLVWDGSSWAPLPPGSLSGTNYYELVAVGGESVIDVTPVNTQSKGSGKAFQRVYLNGVLLREDATSGYTVTGANEITINAPFAPLTAADELVVYED